MKTQVLFIILIVAAVLASGQKKEVPEIEVKAPYYKGEEPRSIYELLASRIQYPIQAVKMYVEGTEVIQFVVKANGELSDIRIINSLSPEIDREVIRALKQTSGKWAPGMVNNEPVEKQHEISLIFKQNASTNFVKLAKKHLAKGNELMFNKNRPDKALRYFNRAILYLPNEESILVSRCLCKYRLGDEPGAENDLTRLKLIAGRNGFPLGDFRLAENADSLLYLFTDTNIPGK